VGIAIDGELHRTHLTVERLDAPAAPRPHSDETAHE
jgi:hypothetical protein